ncbi:MAG TPA: hypothetical protein ENJ33_05645 [Thiothrix sp.]|nr:hypothetical protein [Thiothrix sp.]
MSTSTHSSTNLPIWIIFLFGYFLLITFSTSYAAPPLSSVYENMIKASNKQSSDAYAFKKCRSLQAKPFDKNSTKKKAIIVGDSQGCDFLNGALENSYLNNYQIQFRFIPYACQTIPEKNIANYIAPKHQKFCLQSGRADSLKKAKKQIQEADLIIFAALWKIKVAEKFPDIINYLKTNKQQKMVLIGNKFFGKISPKDYLKMSEKELKSFRNYVGKTSMEINTVFERQLDKRITFVNPHNLLCGKSTTCPLFTDDLQLISYDGRHLTQAGAGYIAKILFKQLALEENTIASQHDKAKASSLEN